MDIRFVAHAADGHSGFDRLAEHVRRQLQVSLRHRSDRVVHVCVRFDHSGGRRSRRDPYCVMRVQLRGAPAATVVDIGTDVYDTIDRAAHRVGRMAEEQLRKADGRRPPAARSEEAASA